MRLFDDYIRSLHLPFFLSRVAYMNIQKFLQFQMTTNIVSLTIVFIAQIIFARNGIELIHLLYVNFVLGTLAAYCYAQETHTRDEVYDPKTELRMANKRKGSFLTYAMRKNITVISIY